MEQHVVQIQSDQKGQHEPEAVSLRIEIYAMLAHLLRQAPDANILRWIAALDVEPPLQTTHKMAAAWPLIKLSAQKANLIAVEQEYQDLFIGIGRGEVVPFASWYLTGSLMEMPLAHLRQDLAVLGFVREEQVKEPEDHIAALLEVMAMLVEEGEMTRQQQFFNRHLATWFPAFFRDLQAAPSASFYSAVAELALQFLTIENTRLAITGQQ